MERCDTSDHQLGKSYQGQYRPHNSVVAARQADMTVLLQIQTGQYHTLNGVGSEVWDMLSDGIAAEQIPDELARLHNISAGRARSDTVQFLEALVARGLLEPTPPV